MSVDRKSRQEMAQLTCCGFGASELNLFVDLRSEFGLSQVGIREQILEVGVIRQSWKRLVGRDSKSIFVARSEALFA
jgi:hypothetical protein